MIRIRRWLFRLLLTVLVIAVSVPTAFLAIASSRQSLPSGREGMPGDYVRADGLDMHFRSWGPKDGPAILLVHGTLAWSQTWAPVAERLAEKGYRVLAADFPPFGYTSRPLDGDYSRVALARRIIAFADAMNLERFVLVGHSFGGGGTMEAAFAHSSRIAGLVLLDPALRLATPRPDVPLGWLMKSPAAGSAVIASTFANPMTTGYGLKSFIKDPAIATDERVAIYRQPLDVKGTTDAIRKWFLTGLYGDERSSRSANLANYRQFKMPVLLVWGRDDTVTPLRQGEALRALLPNAALFVLDDVNHIPQIEKPAETAALILDFAGDLLSSFKLRL